MSIRKRLKGPEVDWDKLDFLATDPRKISKEKMDDLKKIIQLVSPESQEYLKKYLDSPTAAFTDDVDGFDALEEEE